MPILTSAASGGTHAGRQFRFPDLPNFNGADWDLVIEEFGGLDGAVGPRAELVANGGGPGAVAVGDWQPGEAYYSVVGSIVGAIPGDIAPLRSALLRGVPMTDEVSVEILGGSWDVDKQVFVRRYDDVEASWRESMFYFTLPLVAPDPYKYGLTELVTSAGAFENEDWHRLYHEDAGDWYRLYSPDGAEHYRAYETEESETSTQNRVATLDSPGTETSRRVTTTITGPLTAGDWFIDDAAGKRTWVEISLAAGESVVIDTANWATTLRGSPVDHLHFGEFPTLRPGVNSWRLITNGASGDGHMTIRALPAYE